MAASFFSVSFDLIATDRALPFDLYINSSILESRERFVRIFRQGDSLTCDDLGRFKAKYRQIYVLEEQRSEFLRSLVQIKPRYAPESGAGPATNKPTPIEITKTAILKDSAIHHLETLFDKEPNTEVLGQTIVGCRDVVEGMIDVLQDYNIDKLRELIASLSFHDFYTYDHSINVSMYCILIYQTLNAKATRQQIMQAGLAGLLHDLGKIKISTEIINNAGKLSDEEFKEIQKHPDFGHDLLTQTKVHLPVDMDAEQLGTVVAQHHENFDGTGYPRKLQGPQIHVLARITAIADFFDAITTKRSYHEPLSLDDAIALMRKFEGKKIDPVLFQLFLQITKRLPPKAQTKLELVEDFDPCQPRKELPLGVAASGAAPAEASETTGKVVALDKNEKDGYGKVKVITPSDKDDKDYGKVKVLGNGAEAQTTKTTYKKKSA